eukprot:TRINITY_DN2380_c0_g1_i1.p3 TRINITY_DN2380_c0_g1~~TRINITY_DN2380_c0_g1_i1.p3  ORF type:complete len:148 (-),score=12.40 TRINITY_DN2380_c0_g1_i1:290-733(-)
MNMPQLDQLLNFGKGLGVVNSNLQQQINMYCLLRGLQRSVSRQLLFVKSSDIGIQRSWYTAEATFLQTDQVTRRVLDVIKTFENVDQSKLSDKSHFQKDLGLDSLDVVEVVMAIEEEFKVEIPDAEADKILTVKDAVEYITSNPQAE